MKPSSSPSDGLFDGVLSRGDAGTRTSSTDWLRALLDVEAALARAGADAGVVPPEAAARISRTCSEWQDLDPGRIGRLAAASGNPVVPLVALLEERVGPDGGQWVHFGATSQDVMDTAAVLVARRAGEPVLVDLRSAADAAAGLAAAHRDTPILGRTLLQPALPTTFGLKAAGWTVSLDHAARRLSEAVAALPVQLGGAVGDLGSYGEHGEVVLAALARQLSLPEPVLPWHTARGPFADLGGALGAAGGAIGKVALDVCLLAQGEVAEVHEGKESGRGGSSAMPHKHNPVAAIAARAAAVRGPGLVATLLTAMGQEHERAAGGWHAEWEVLSDLLRTTGSAAAWLAECLQGLVVDPARMAANLQRTGATDAATAEAAATLLAPALGRERAHLLVREALDRSRSTGRPLGVELVADPRWPTGTAVPTRPCSAGRFVDRALASRRHP